MRIANRYVLSIIILHTLVRQSQAQKPPPLEPAVLAYVKSETEKLSARPLAGVESAGEWKTQSTELRRRLKEMLGLDPEPPRGPLQARVTGEIETPDFVVEKLIYQSIPGLYVTGNLYRPKAIDKPLPAIVYVCGHSRVEKNGLILGSKTHYQHHPEWYASNGYVCLVVDTLELGEVPGIHHGLYHYGMWNWTSEGYTPAGVETWNAIRALDYLLTRKEVDPARIGITGRSGGGAVSWFAGAVDERFAVVAPVAGITDLENHVVDGVIDGHCDCMYYVNAYRWDFPTVAALVAPRPLLIENTDNDPIFPLDGVRRIHAQATRAYAWLDAPEKLSLVIGKGGHEDTTEIRWPSFAFMNKWLRKVDEPVAEPARRIADEKLRVLGEGEMPADEINSRVHELFVVKPKPTPPARDERSWEVQRARLLALAKSQVLGEALGPVTIPDLPLDLETRTGAQGRLMVRVGNPTIVPQAGGWSDLRARRRLYLLGLSLDGLAVGACLRAFERVRTEAKVETIAEVEAECGLDQVPPAVWAAVFDPKVEAVKLRLAPGASPHAIAYINFDRRFNMQQALFLLYPRPVTLVDFPPSRFQWARDSAYALNPSRNMFKFEWSPKR